jgi:uncharacterized protein HI_1423
MDKITLSEKAEKEIVKAAKMSAFSSYTEYSQNLMTTDDIAIYFNKSYNFTAQNIVSRTDFPASRYFNSKKERPRYVAGEVVKWGKRYLKRL